MRWTVLPLVTLAAASLAAPATAALSDFRLPDPAQQQPPPDRQGPVAPDVPASRGRQATPPPTPAPAATPTPEPTIDPSLVPPAVSRTPAPRPAVREQPTNAAPADATDSPPASAAPAGVDLPAADAMSSPLPVAPVPAATTVQAEDGRSLWPWALAGLAVLAALAFAAWAWRRRPRGAAVFAVPEIERPRVTPPPAAAEPLQVALEPLRLSLTLLNATLAYRLEVVNRGTSPISELQIGADMISAHASMTREEQLAGPRSGAATVQRIERLEPGESRIVEGEFRVPFSQIVPIRQGNAALLLPLARFRLEASGAAPVVRTFAVGQPGPKAGLQPFRLDLGPRVYPRLTQRAFA